MNIFWFLVKEGFKGLLRSKYASFFSIIIIMISIVLVGLGYVASRDLLFAVDNIRAQFDVDIFTHKTATEEEISDLSVKLHEMTEIMSVSYISPDSAALKFKKDFGEDIFDVLEENPLPASFTIRLKPIYRNLISVEGIAAIILKNTIVDEVKYRKKFLVVLEKYQRYILITVLVIFAFFSLMSVVLISNTIKMTIFSRRDAISTMKLLGATKSFIRSPFVIEGTLQGFLGSCFAFVFIFSVFYVINNYLQNSIEYKALVSYRFYAAIVTIGSFMGFIGSLRAIRKFL